MKLKQIIKKNNKHKVKNIKLYKSRQTDIEWPKEK